MALALAVCSRKVSPDCARPCAPPSTLQMDSPWAPRLLKAGGVPDTDRIPVPRRRCTASLKGTTGSYTAIEHRRPTNPVPCGTRPDHTGHYQRNHPPVGLLPGKTAAARPPVADRDGMEKNGIKPAHGDQGCDTPGDAAWGKPAIRPATRKRTRGGVLSYRPGAVPGGALVRGAAPPRDDSTRRGSWRAP